MRGVVQGLSTPVPSSRPAEQGMKQFSEPDMRYPKPLIVKIQVDNALFRAMFPLMLSP